MCIDSKRNCILIIDSDHNNINIVTRFLSDQGLNVHVSTSGSEGISHAQQLKPDLILLDIDLPDIDGHQACYKFKNHVELKDTPIICFTNSSSLEDKLKAFSIGCVDYVVKPVQEAELLARVSVHLKIADLIDALEGRNVQLQSALKTAHVVNVAIGMLMERNKIDREAAFELIRKKARDEQRKAADVADETINSLGHTIE